VTSDRFGIFKFIAFIVLALTFSLMVVMGIIFVFDIKVDNPSINPSAQSHQKVMHLFYPDPSSTAIPQMISDVGAGGKLENPEILSVDVFLQYDGILAEGKPVAITANGYLYPRGENVVTGLINRGNQKLLLKTILVGFEGASLYNVTESSLSAGSTFALTLQSASMLQFSNLPTKEQLQMARTITWDTQGDYYPYLSIPTNDGTLIVAYPDYRIHVSGSDIVRQENYAKITTALTIVLFFFTLISSAEMLYKLRPEIISKILGIKNNSEKTKNHGTDHP
jgi:hypothetical protein